MVPNICDGLGSLMRFHTMDVEEGWTKVVVSPAAMLKVFQLSMAFCEAVRVSCEPLCVVVTVPRPTVMPVGLASTFAAKPTASRPVMTRHKTESRRSRNVRIKILFPDFIAEGI